MPRPAPESAPGQTASGAARDAAATPAIADHRGTFGRGVERVCDRVIIIGHGRLLEHDSIAALKSRHRRIVELAPASETDRYCTVLQAAVHKVTRLSNGKLRVESATDSVAWVLELMQAHRMPPAEMVSNPDAWHELGIKSISAGHEPQP